MCDLVFWFVHEKVMKDLVSFGKCFIARNWAAAELRSRLFIDQKHNNLFV